MDSSVIIVGAGMAGLSAGCMLAKAGYQVTVLEQNYLPGGCSSSYWRRGFVFEAGATTLVGLDEGMPLRHILDHCQITVKASKLDVPMQIMLADGSYITRYASLNDWISEAERVFGHQGQRAFWEQCHKISDFVWDTSLKQLQFPPQSLADLWATIKTANLKQVLNLPFAMMSTSQLLDRFGLGKHETFRQFVDEQLIITAQNTADQVNALFGATALCYTMIGNYYCEGGLINLVNPMVDYINQTGDVKLRHEVKSAKRVNKSWQVETKKGTFNAQHLIWAVPLNNVVDLQPELTQFFSQDVLPAGQLASAFQVGIGFKPSRTYQTLHYQLHLEKPLIDYQPGQHNQAGSIFLSLSDPNDISRTDEPGMMVANISTHIHQPDRHFQLDKQYLVDRVLDRLETAQLINRSDIVYLHASDPKDWQQWTKRKWGFVGGYPQFMHIRPWEMVGHKLPLPNAWICGDTTYPGQGIPGASLSGLLTARKLIANT